MSDVRRAARRLGLQTVGVLATVLAVVAMVTFVAYERVEHADAEATLHQASERSDISRLRPGLWGVEVRGGRRAASGPSPAGLPLEEDLDRVLDDGRPRQREIDVASGAWFVRTSPRGDGVVQVALDRTFAEESSGRVVKALLLSSVVGLLLAGAGAVLLARRAMRPLEEALSLQRRFVADASHELRTPLTLLSTRVQLLSRRMARLPQAPADAAVASLRGDVDGLKADAAALTDVLDELLLAADPGAADQRIPCEVSALVAACVAAAQPSAGSRGLSVAVGSAVPVVASVSEVALRRAVTSMIDNGLDHARSSVRLQVRPRGRVVEILVSDDGPGVPERDRQRVFERFASSRPRTAQEDPAQRRHYGIGLSLVADVARAHGGSVVVRQREDGSPGAEFVLTLPA